MRHLNRLSIIISTVTFAQKTQNTTKETVITKRQLRITKERELQ